MRPARASRSALSVVAAMVALLTTVACASSRPSASKDDAPAPSEPATEAAPASAPASALAMVPTAPPAIPSGMRLPGPFNPPGGLPLATPGEGRTEFEGCLALASPETEGPAKAPYVENTRGMGGDGPEIALRPTPAGVVVTHALHHNCCQKADVQTKVEGEKITLTETFTGPTCRCNCRSTLKTTVGLKPGTYALEVIRIDNGPPKSVYTGSVSIQSLMAPKPR